MIPWLWRVQERRGLKNDVQGKRSIRITRSWRRPPAFFLTYASKSRPLSMYTHNNIGRLLLLFLYTFIFCVSLKFCPCRTSTLHYCFWIVIIVQLGVESHLQSIERCAIIIISLVVTGRISTNLSLRSEARLRSKVLSDMIRRTREPFRRHPWDKLFVACNCHPWTSQKSQRRHKMCESWSTLVMPLLRNVTNENVLKLTVSLRYSRIETNVLLEDRAAKILAQVKKNPRIL